MSKLWIGVAESEAFHGVEVTSRPCYFAHTAASNISQMSLPDRMLGVLGARGRTRTRMMGGRNSRRSQCAFPKL